MLNSASNEFLSSNGVYNPTLISELEKFTCRLKKYFHFYLNIFINKSGTEILTTKFKKGNGTEMHSWENKPVCSSLGVGLWYAVWGSVCNACVQVGSKLQRIIRRPTF